LQQLKLLKVLLLQQQLIFILAEWKYLNMGVSVLPTPSSGSVQGSLTLQQTITSTTNNVSIPAGTNFVYAVVIGGGSAGSSGSANTGNGAFGGFGGGSGGIQRGWTLKSTSCVIGAGGGYSQYGMVYAPGAGATVSISNVPASVGGSGYTGQSVQQSLSSTGTWSGGNGGTRPDSGGGSGNTGGSSIIGGGGASGQYWTGANSAASGGGGNGILFNGGSAGTQNANFGAGGGGGAGYLGAGGNGGNGSTANNGIGGNGGSGGGGGGGGASGTSGNTVAGGAGGSGCVLLYY
jgi:hypothetical protein